MSLLQDSRLNYIEQHAERIGLDSDKLENLRVSASKASPMGDTLDLCARFATGQALNELVGLCALSLGACGMLEMWACSVTCSIGDHV